MCALLSPHLNLPAGARGGLGQPRAPLRGWSQAQQRTFVAAWSQGGRREDPVLAWQRCQGVSTEPGTRFPDKFCTYLVTKGRFVLGTDCWNKSLECSALCLVSLGWDCFSLCSLHTSRGKLCQHASFFPCVAFLPSPHFFPSAALSCECWSCCTRGFWWSTHIKWEGVEPFQWQKQSLLKSEALLQKCSLWAQSNDHWLYKSLSAPAHFIIFVLGLLHPSFQKHLAALQPGQSQRSNCALIYRQQSSTCTASEPVGPCSLQTASA